jgi:hypothetical protein
MFTELKRCVRCHQRYPERLGHRFPLTPLSAGHEQDLEQAFRTWLGSKKGQIRRVPGAETADRFRMKGLAPWIASSLLLV